MTRESMHKQARANGVTARLVATFWHWRAMGADMRTAEGEALASVKHDGMRREECRQLLRAAVRENKALAVCAALGAY